MMFERFTQRARQVLVVAQEEARALDHNFVGTEHLLLGLLAGEGVAARVLAARGLTHDAVASDIVRVIGPGRRGLVDDRTALASIGIDLDSITEAVDEAFGSGALWSAMMRNKEFVGRLRFAPRARKVIELSLREALALGHHYIGTEHLLLAIVREGDGVAAMILSERAGPLADVRDAVLDALREYRTGA